MNPDQQAALGDKDDEISDLMETVLKSIQRLEVLTGGAVDTVADRQGRTIVLQLAKEQFCQSEVAKQAAILNALPAHIALLDYRGVVISVNDAWRRFAVSNMLPGTELGIGQDYLAVCESARGADAAEALHAAAGIRTVLNGTATSFALEYACHSPTQQRWFLVTVTPLNDEHRIGAIVMHLDITERRLAEYALEALTQKAQQRERILSTTLACISDFAYVYDRDCRFVFANQPLLDLWGISLDEVVGKNFLDLGYPHDTATKLARDVQRVFDTKTSLTGELPYTSPSGLFGIYEYIFSPVINSDGCVELVVGSSRDVTARRSAIEAIRVSEQEQRKLAQELEIERSRLVAAQRVAKVGSWEMDVTTMSLIWSAETHRIHETDAATFYPTLQSYLELVHPRDREAVEEVFRQSLCSVGPHTIEHCVSLSDGRTKVVQERWHMILGQNGNPIRAIGTCQDITERKEIEAARERLAVILESTSDLVGISDPAGQVLYLNHAGRHVLGFGQQENLSQIKIVDLLPDPWNHPVITTGIPTAVRDGNWSGETVLKRRNGLEIPVSQVLLAHKASDGTLEYLSTIVRDVTDRVLAETAARAKDAEFRNLTESMPQIVWITKANGKNVYFNQQWMDYTGLTLEESLGDCWKPFHPDDHELARNAWQQATASTGVYSIESRLRRADGVYRWWLIRGVPQMDSSGNALKWFGTCTDIHDMKEAVLQICSSNKSLRESERRFNDMFSNVALATVMLDCEARITFCNEFLLHLTGWQLEEVIGKNWFEFFVPADSQHTRQVFESIIRTEPKTWHHENQIITRSGERRLVRWNTSILRTGLGEVAGTASIGEDITDQKRAETEIQTLNATLEQRVIDRTLDFEIARNDAVTATQVKSRFLATVSHEIRTPMNGVIGIADVLYQSALSADQLEMVDLIRESGSALLSIIDDILDFSKIEAGRLQVECIPFVLTDVVENACAMLDRFALKKDVEFTLYIDPALPRLVQGDGLRLRQVLLNLLSNAIKFSSGRDQVGRVSVQVVQSKRVNGRTVVEISVRDNGIGMDQATQSRLFKAFTQADASTTRRFGGTGLGLVISRHLIDLMGGDISVKSAPGEGSTFTVRLSLACDNDSSDMVAPGSHGQVTFASSQIAGICCVVIGAQGGIAQYIAAYLAADGVRVERALSPVHLLDLMGRLPSGPWIWIVDLVETPAAVMVLRELAGKLPKHQVTFLVIGRGARRVEREQSGDLFVLDGNVLTRKRLMRAVAMASGRMVNDPAMAPFQRPARENKSAPRQKSLRNCQPILVAEDNEINQQVIVRQLDLLGFTSDVVDTGEAALQRWRSADYALLLTDLHMPKMDGYELAGAIRSLECAQAASELPDFGSATGRRLPIIALTANVLKGEADRCRAAGMDDYLTKPVQLTQLKDMLDTWLPPALSNQSSMGAGISPLLSCATSVVTSSTDPTVAVDVRVLEKLIGTDPALILEFLGDFQRSATEIVRKLQLACRSGDATVASAQAHKLKSSARSVGALALGDLCEAIEAGVKDDDFESRLLLLDDFERELAAVNAFLDLFDAQGADRPLVE